MFWIMCPLLSKYDMVNSLSLEPQSVNLLRNGIAIQSSARDNSIWKWILNTKRLGFSKEQGDLDSAEVQGYVNQRDVQILYATINQKEKNGVYQAGLLKKNFPGSLVIECDLSQTLMLLITNLWENDVSGEPGTLLTPPTKAPKALKWGLAAWWWLCLSIIWGYLNQYLLCSQCLLCDLNVLHHAHSLVSVLLGTQAVY